MNSESAPSKSFTKQRNTIQRDNDTTKVAYNSEAIRHGGRGANSRTSCGLKNRKATTIGPTMAPQWPHNQKGFSFMEVMLTMSLFLLLAGVGVGAYFKYYTFSLANADVKNTFTLLKQARFRALKNPDSSDYGVHLDPATRTLTVFKNTYNPVDPENIELELEQLDITDLSLNPSIGITDDVIFQKQTGKTSNNGAFTISNQTLNYTFTINSQGVIN